jgi:hypothetical protein
MFSDVCLLWFIYLSAEQVHVHVSLLSVLTQVLSHEEGVNSSLREVAYLEFQALRQALAFLLL